MLSKENVFVVPKELLRGENEIRSISVYGKNLPEAWEDAVLATLEFGSQMPTEYDAEMDPESRVATMMITLTDPFAEPRIHKSFPDGLEGLYIYTEEVVHGVHDHRIRKGGWSYSYNDRLRNWPGKDYPEGVVSVDQIENICQKLAKVNYTRRAQAITWNPYKDPQDKEPPCLQRVWGQVIKSEEGYFFDVNTNWRSRDGFKAAFMNMFAITELQRVMAARISELSGQEVRVGRYVDISDNFHLYGSYMRRENGHPSDIDRFINSIEKRSFEQRTLRSDDPFVLQEFGFGKQRLQEEQGK